MGTKSITVVFIRFLAVVSTYFLVANFLVKNDEIRNKMFNSLPSTMMGSSQKAAAATTIQQPNISHLPLDAQNLLREYWDTKVPSLREQKRILNESGRLPRISEKGLSLDGWTQPKNCSGISNAHKITEDEPVPGYFDRRIAIIFNRLAFRGYCDLAQTLFKESKDAARCTKASYEIQMATCRVYLQNVIHPIEMMGFEVDIFLQTHVSTLVNDRIGNETITSYFNDLANCFNENRTKPRVVSTSLTVYTGSEGKPQVHHYAQQTSFNIVEQYLLQEPQKRYRSFAVLRHDMFPKFMLINTTSANVVESVVRELIQYDKQPFHNLTNSNLRGPVVGGDHYLIRGGSNMARFDDQIHFFPGFMLNCMMGYNSLSVERIGEIYGSKYIEYKIQWMEPPDVTASMNNVKRDGGHSMIGSLGYQESINRGRLPYPESIYRGQYGMNYFDDGMVDCHLLRHHGGPPCGPFSIAKDFCNVIKRKFVMKYNSSEELKYDGETKDLFEKLWERIQTEKQKRIEEDNKTKTTERMRQMGFPIESDELISKDEFFKKTQECIEGGI